METIQTKDSQSSYRESSPTGATQGARRATGVAPVGGGREIAQSAAADPEVPAHKRRRRLTAGYKLRILQEADQCNEPGQLGALLRREGLYSSSLTRWRRQREEGILSAMAPKRRGRKAVAKSPLADEVAKLHKENERLRKRLWQAERIIEAQKKISEILGISQDLQQTEGSDS